MFRSNPFQVAAQLTVFIGTQISLRLMVVVLYLFPLAYRAVQFPTDTAQTLLTEQEKQPVNNNGPSAKVEAPAAPTPVTANSQAAPVSSEKPPLPPADSTPTAGTPDPEKSQDPTVPTTTAGVPAEPGSRVPDAQERRRKRRLLIIHTRLARFFTWILLLGFVILPSTFTRDQGHQADDDQNPTGSETGGESLTDSAINHIANLGLYVPSFLYSFLFLRSIIFEKTYIPVLFLGWSF